MKFIYIFLILITSTTWANSQGILRCLGLEEAKLHQNKITGPIFNLNQRLISELIQIPGVRIGQTEYRRICGGRGHESLKLLEEILSQGKNLFVNRDQGLQGAMTEGMIDDFVLISKEIFLNFVSQVQMLSPTPHCLNENIPSLTVLLDRLKHLEDEVEIQALFGKRDLQIFKQLEDYPLFFKACEKSKKTETSGSTSSK